MATTNDDNVPSDDDSGKAPTDVVGAFSSDLMPESAVLEDLRWVLRKRLELWVDVQLGEMVRDHVPDAEIRDWYRRVIEAYGWKLAPHFVTWLLLEPHPAIPLQGYETEVSDPEPDDGYSSWRAHRKDFADDVERARQDLEAFDSAAGKSSSRPAKLRAQFGAFGQSEKRRRDAWLAALDAKAVEYLREPSRNTLNSLCWALTSGYAKAFGVRNPKYPEGWQAERVQDAVKTAAAAPNVTARLRSSGAKAKRKAGPQEAARVLAARLSGLPVGASTVRNAAGQKLPK